MTYTISLTLSSTEGFQTAVKKELYMNKHGSLHDRDDVADFDPSE